MLILSINFFDFIFKLTFNANCPPLVFINDTFFLRIKSSSIDFLVNQIITIINKIAKIGRYQFVFVITFNSSLGISSFSHVYFMLNPWRFTLVGSVLNVVNK